MRKPLRSLVDIRVGHSFRTRIENEPAGDIRVLQIRDIKGSDEIRTDSLPRMTWQGSDMPPLLKSGDVVMPARGDRYDAGLIRSPEPMIASGQLYILHPRNAGLTSDYLCWFLNQAEAHNYILKNRAGTGIPSLNRSVLGDLSVPVPPLDVQHKITELNEVWTREQAVTMQLLANRQQILDGIFNKLVLK